jgi:citrate lyase beta subunit
MRHFARLAKPELERLFAVAPAPFGPEDDRERLAVALGATLYMPATRPTLAADLRSRTAHGVVSAVLCLEDAISDSEQAAAGVNLVNQLQAFAADPTARHSGAPLIFVRVRHPEQIPVIARALGDDARVLTGFVLPKFTDASGGAFFEALDDTADHLGHRYYAMPVLESAEVVHAETRQDTLTGVARLLAKHRDSVLAVRIGATDMCAAFGIRRGRDVTIYDVHAVASAIADVVNVFGRADGTGFVVTGPVWEYFPIHPRLFKPQLRISPFVEPDAKALRAELITRHLDGLIREVVLDQANGLTGKTVIHPSHVGAVHALSVVTHEEHSDALDIVRVDAAGGGVVASKYANKMNEARPHRAWAERTLTRAGVFGVAAEGISVVDLLAATA